MEQPRSRGGDSLADRCRASFTVTLWDLKDELVEQARVRVRKNVQRVAAKASPGNEEATVTQVMGRITFTSALEVAARSPQLVVEAIVENLAIKQGLFARLDKLTPASTIFASNTSSLEIGHICNGIRPKQFGGVHFVRRVRGRRCLPLTLHGSSTPFP